MKASIKYNKFFAFSQIDKQYFSNEFSDGINIVHGKNTSGKSSLIQAIQYTFGINDEKRKLAELLKQKVIFRLDLTLYTSKTCSVSIVRDDEIISIRVDDQKPVKFVGISGNKSREHLKLKSYLSELLGFELYLEYDGEYKPASIEAMFLPYYVAQDIGWVSRHKSFRGLDFVKNFKNDFFDYYLGIVNCIDREEKSRLDREKKELESELKLLDQIYSNNREIKVSKLKDEAFVSKTLEYIEPYKENKAKLIEIEKNYLSVCNKLTLQEERRKVLLRVRRSLKKDILAVNTCPTCAQELSHSTEETYNYFQDLNDTDSQLEELAKNIKNLKETQSKLNSLLTQISETKTVVEKDYYELLDYNVDNVTFSSWLKNKINLGLSDELKTKIADCTSKVITVNQKLAKFKADDEVKKERNNASHSFKIIFEKFVAELNIKPFDDECFYLLYDIPAFPRQGVELLKTLLAYNFAFVKMIKKTDYTHVLPLMLDAIFEGDFEDESKEEIFSFISKNAQKDQQLIFSIADSKLNVNSAKTYNEKHFKDNARLICIGDNNKTRALLNEYDEQIAGYLDETYDILG